MLLTEYNEAETLEMFKRDYLAEGRAEGTETERLNTIGERMRTLNMTVQRAMAALEIPSSEQEECLIRI